MRQIGAILICLFFISGSVSAQRLSLREDIRERIDSVVKGFGYNPSSVSIIADTSIRKMVREQFIEHPLAIVIVKSISATRVNFNDRLINVSGFLNEFTPSKRPTDFLFVMQRAPDDEIETLRSIPVINVSKEPTFWESVAQPALITAGAALAIVLFFLVRS